MAIPARIVITASSEEPSHELRLVESLACSAAGPDEAEERVGAAPDAVADAPAAPPKSTGIQSAAKVPKEQGGSSEVDGSTPDVHVKAAVAAGSAVLTTLARRSAALLPGSLVSAMLAEAGITDATVLAAMGIGGGALELADGWSSQDWAVFHHHGLVGRGNVLHAAHLQALNLPTRDPRAPELVTGWARMMPPGKRTTLGTAAGIVCAPSITDEPRVVLVDGPLLGLQLAQAGVAGVALVDEAEALVPLRDWLARRDVLLVGRRHGRLAALQHALGNACRAAPLVLVGEPGQWREEAFTALGVDRAVFALPAAAPAAITPRLLLDLHAAAREAVARGHGHEVLRLLGLDGPAVADIYEVGVLPPGYRDALDRTSARALLGHRLGGAALIPARDEHGVVVDLWVVHPDGAAFGLFRSLAGLLASAVASAFRSLVVVDRVSDLGGLAREGRQDVLLMRSVEDARVNAARMRCHGVEVVELHVSGDTAAYAAAFTAAGITATMPAPAATPRGPVAVVDATVPGLVPLMADESVATVAAPAAALPGPALVDHDRAAHRATFTAGPLTYVAEVPIGSDTRSEVTVRGPRGHLLADRCDWSSAAARARFVACLAPTAGAEPAVLDADLVAVHAAVRALATPVAAERVAPPMTDEERLAAMELLRAEDLLTQVSADLGELGWVGEEPVRALLYLTAIGRKLADPLWSALTATAGAADPQGLRLIADLTPPEDLVPLAALTDAAWLHEHPAALRHALVVVDDPGALPGHSLMALRQLDASGAVTPGHVRSPAQRPGQARSTAVVARGPVALLAIAAGRLGDPLAGRCLAVLVDESAAQTARVLAAQRQRRADPARYAVSPERRTVLCQRHHHAQRLLAAAAVVIPFAESIRFPATAVRHRGDQRRFLALVEACALLHQHRRLRDAGRVVADRRDFDIAARLFAATGTLDGSGMSRHASALLEALWARGSATTATMDDVRQVMPDWTDYAARAAVAELVALEYLAASRGGRGRARSYRLTGTATPHRPTITLADPTHLDAVREFADVRETGSRTLP
jgi:hypothetical protein